jgi:glyoxylase-like metal-dependent hydrolase (beta-lactamase superfamily II)
MCKKPQEPDGRRGLKALLPVLVVAGIALLQGGRATARGNGEELVMTFDLGDSRISVLSEEQRTGRADALTGATPQMIQTWLPDGSYPAAVNAFLVQMPDRNILVASGCGRRLFDRIHSLGLTEEDIHVILLTHLHGGHAEGLLRGDTAAFPRAELYLSQPEYDYRTGGRPLQVPDSCTGGFGQAGRVVAAYGERLHLFVPAPLPETASPEGFPVPGVQAVAAYGPTPGHTAYLFESGGSRLLVWGAVIHAMRIQMPCPEVGSVCDADPALSAETRRRILSYVSAGKIPVAGMHIAFPGIGDVVSTGSGGYAFEPYCLCLGL